MKKLLLLLSCLFILTACGQELEAADIAGVWKNDGARIRFGEDGGYEITYAAPEPGGLSSENGEFELDGGTVELRLRDKYTFNELGETDFQR